MIRVRFLAAVLVLTAATQVIAADEPGPDLWPGSGLVPPGGTTFLAHPNAYTNILLWEAGTVDQDGARFTVLREDGLGTFIERGESWYSRSGDGDVLLHGTLDHLTGEERRFDPPLVMLDLPLEVGKTWRTQSICSVTRPSGGLAQKEAVDIVRTVEGADDMKMQEGPVPTVLITEKVTAGSPLGEMWYSPERGIMSRRRDGASEWEVIRERSNHPTSSLAAYGKPVNIRFNWPINQTLRIDWTSSFEMPTGEFVVTSTKSYQVRVEADGEGRRLVIPWEVIAPLDSLSVAPAVCARWREVQVAFRVDREGRFLGVADRVALHASFLSFLRDIRDTNPNATGVAWTDSAMQMGITPEMMEQNLSAFWDVLAGWWCGVETEIGAITFEEATTPMHIMPGADIRMRRARAATSFAPCDTTAAGLDCIIFNQASYSRDPVATALYSRVMAEFVGGAAAANEGYIDREIRADVIAVVDPSTGMPRQVLQGRREKGWHPNGAPIFHTFETEELTLTVLDAD